MKSVVARFVVSAALAAVLSVASLAQVATPTIQFSNQSGDDATVKLAGGPTSGYVDVPNGGSATVSVRSGLYWIVTRYCDRRGACSYSRGETFTVTQTPYSVSRISITLHKVANGNYRTDPASAREF